MAYNSNSDIAAKLQTTIVINKSHYSFPNYYDAMKPIRKLRHTNNSYDIALFTQKIPAKFTTNQLLIQRVFYYIYKSWSNAKQHPRCRPIIFTKDIYKFILNKEILGTINHPFYEVFPIHPTTRIYW